MNHPNNAPGVALNHPAHTDWQEQTGHVGIDLFRKMHDRFQSTDVDVTELMLAYEAVNKRLDGTREAIEKAHVAELGLTEAGRKTYEELAGDAVRVPEYLYWFSQLSAYKAGQEVALDLGGTRHEGDWDGVDRLDHQIRQGIAGIALLNPGSSIDYETVQAKPISRRIKPHYPRLQPDVMYADFAYAVAHVREPIADIVVPGGRPIDIYSEFTALIVLNQLPVDEREAILKAYQDASTDESKWDKLCKAVNSEPALIAHQAIERALESPDGVTTDVAPLTTHHVMLARS